MVSPSGPLASPPPVPVFFLSMLQPVIASVRTIPAKTLVMVLVMANRAIGPTAVTTSASGFLGEHGPLGVFEHEGRTRQPVNLCPALRHLGRLGRTLLEQTRHLDALALDLGVPR